MVWNGQNIVSLMFGWNGSGIPMVRIKIDIVARVSGKIRLVEGFQKANRECTTASFSRGIKIRILFYGKP